MLLLLAALALSALDARRPAASAYWLAALTPALVVLALVVVAADNFAHTVFGVGVTSSEDTTRAFVLIAVLAAGAWILQSEAMALARPSPRRAVRLLAAGLIVTTLLAYGAARGRSAGVNVVGERGVARAGAMNILLVGIDGLDAGDVAPYDPARDTPSIRALAERGTTFENAFSNAGRTYGSLISMLTGKPATETHILFPPVYLSGRDAVEHAPGLLRSHGYTTAQIGMRHYNDAEDWNMQGAFDLVNGRSQRPMRPDRSESLERLRRYQHELLERVSGRFLHLLFIRRLEDAHSFLVLKGKRSPYFEDERRVRMAEAFLQARREPWLLLIHLVDTHCCSEDRDERIRLADRNVGRLVQLLRATGQLERTAIVMYSDHTPRWGTLGRIPLLLVVPGRTSGTSVATNVQLADVAPTLLELSGIAKPAWMTGHSLLRAKELSRDRPIFSLVELGTNGLVGPEMKVVQDATPPLYGAASAAVVVCHEWAKLTFAMRRFDGGVIAGHSAPCADAPDRDEVTRRLAEHLRTNGYPVP